MVDGSEATRLIDMGLRDFTTAPHNVVLDEDDELPPHNVDVEDEDEEIVESRSLFAEFGLFKLKFEILEVILSLFTELGREFNLMFAKPRRLSLLPSPLVFRISSYKPSAL